MVDSGRHAALCGSPMRRFKKRREYLDRKGAYRSIVRQATRIFEYLVTRSIHMRRAGGSRRLRAHGLVGSSSTGNVIGAIG